MKIEYQRSNSMPFSSISLAEVFMSSGKTFMKIDPTPSKETEEIYNVVKLETGLPYHFDDDEIVTKVNATLIVKEY